jgi:hypothetical protein
MLQNANDHATMTRIAGAMVSGLPGNWKYIGLTDNRFGIVYVTIGYLRVAHVRS